VSSRVERHGAVLIVVATTDRVAVPLG